MLLAIPCFLASVFIELSYLVRANRSARTDRKRLLRAVTKANIYSYLVLLGLDALWFSFRTH